MGMYNEVFYQCPSCGARLVEQIAQIELGFGGYDLSDVESLAETLDTDQLLELKAAVLDMGFYCDVCEVNHVPYPSEYKSVNDKTALAKRLFN